MNKRNYNVFFNTHTVSGIVISIALYVIFLAGAFALFMENINHWEINERGESANVIVDYDRVLDEVAAQGYQMHGRSFMIDGHQEKITISSRPLRDTTLAKNSLHLLSDSVSRGGINMAFDAHSYAVSKAKGKQMQKAQLGHFLFELHYFNQIPRVGILLSGLVSLFFLFAIITGLIIHWDKILSYFFTFRLKATLKNLWTDAHTTLSIIGLPYQLMFALTGTVFGLSVLLFLPFAKVLYNGDNVAMLEDVFPSPATRQYEMLGYSDSAVSINPLVVKTVNQVPEESKKHITVSIKNYHDANAHLVVNVINDQPTSFFNTVESIYRLSDGALVHEKQEQDLPPYAVGMVEFLHKIHFGHYGGNFIKVLYFLMALLTCLVIISGVMVWLKARSAKKYEGKRKFINNVGAIYLGACLGLYPAIALLFVLSKTFPAEMSNRFTYISWLFLAFWVGYTLYSYVIKNYFRINRNALILAGIMGVLIPLCNGLHSGLWLWKSLTMGYPDTFAIDLIWLIAGITTLIIAFNIKPLVEAPPKRKVKAMVKEAVG